MINNGSMWAGAVNPANAQRGSMDIMGLMSAPLHPAFNASSITTSLGISGPDSPCKLTHSPQTDSHSPHTVQSSPPPLRHKNQPKAHNDSFSSATTVNTNSKPSSQDQISFHTAAADKNFTFGGNGNMTRWDSPGLDMYANYGAHGPGSPSLDEFGGDFFSANDDDTPNRKKLADQFSSFGMGQY
jgi:hypothetical protein